MENRQFFQNNGRLDDVVIIRSLAIIWVVAFHAYYMMLVPAHFPASQAMYHDMYYTFNCIILQFHLPLFIMISGYLFSHLENDRGKYATFRELIKNKFRRLIIPFYVFVTVFMLTTNDFSWEPYYSWGYQHLWFVTMLFWCFIVTRLLSFLPFCQKRWFKAMVFFLFFLLNLVPRLDIPFFAVPNILRWYFWFYFGYLLYLNRDGVYGFIDRNRLAVLSLLVVLTVVCLGYKGMVITDDSVHTWYGEVGNMTITVLIWYLANRFLLGGMKKDGVMRKLNWLNKYSYGIYIFHNWLQPFMISSTATALFYLDVLAVDHPVLFPFLFFVSSFVVSLGLSWLVLKTRVGKFLIG